LQQLANGLVVGSVYAVLAVGFTLTFGVIKLLNFAHGEFYTVAAFAAFGVATYLGPAHLAASPYLSTIVLVVSGVVVAAIVGGLAERVAFRPIDRALRIPLLVSSLGVSLFLQNAILLLVGGQYQNFPNVIALRRFEVGGITVTNIGILIVLVTVVIMLVLRWIVMHTRFGKAMRAVALDPTTTQLMGVNVNRVVMLTFVLSAAMAGIAGMMVAYQYKVIFFQMGYSAVLKAFVASVIGGVGNIYGAVVGGVGLGLLEALASGYISSEWKDAFAFVCLIGVLLIRPGGLFGEITADRY
jgi:branched-chain amino acid transport system permease protein